MGEEKEYMKRLWKSKKTIIEMLKDRGHTVEEIESFEDFIKTRSVFGSGASVKNEDILNLKLSATNPPVEVYWHNKLSTEIIKSYSEFLAEESIDHIIFVCNNITSPAEEAIKNLKTLYDIEVFFTSYTIINITKHQLVPRHRICTAEEKREILSSYNTSLAKLPQILLSDPICRYYHAKKNDIFLIERNSNILKGEKIITYRVVA